MSDLRRAAVELAERGWHLFPVKPRGKRPIPQNGFYAATAEPARIDAFWRRHPDANIGLYPAPSGLLVIDIDGPTGEATAERLGLLPESETLESRTGRKAGGRHRYFIHPGVPIRNVDLGPDLDVRADKGYVIVPPSVHPSGAAYTWVTEFSALRPLTERELALLTAVGTQSLASRDGSPESILEGSRHTSLTAYTGKLLAAGRSEEEVLTLVHEHNRTLCMPPLPLEEVNRIVYDIAKADREKLADPAITELNRTYAFIIVGDKSAILEEDPDHNFRLLGLGAFRDLLRPHRVGLDIHSRPLADHWLSHKRRRQYKKLVFAPGDAGETVEGCYNLWRGFAVEPNPAGDCGLFLGHIRENVCQGREDLYLWVIGWFAQMIQQPTQKPGTSLVLRGPQGVGKTFIGKTIGVLLGKHYTPVSNPRYIIGRFNGHLTSSLLLHADEGFWAGDHTAEGMLKDLITGEDQWIEFKGREAICVRNYVRLLVTGNADWIVPAGMEERRFAVLDVGTGHIQDHAYFAAIEEELKNGGYGALLHHLQTFDLSQVNLRRIPETGALLEQKIASLSPKQAWLLDILMAGKLPADQEGAGQTATRIVFEDYVKHAQNVGTRHKGIETELGIFLRKHLPGLQKRPGTYTDDTGTTHQSMIYHFPPLPQCRESFGKAIRFPVAWGEPTSWLKSGF